MVAIKAQHVATFLKSIDPGIDAVLAFGPDAGMVAERATDAAKRLAARDDPPGEILRIEDTDLETDPDRLTIELETIPMFGGRKVVRTTASRRVTAAMLKPLLEGTTRLAGSLVVEAGNLRADEALRALFEKSPRAAALPCYADEAQDIVGLIAEVTKAARLDISADARQLLASRLGADRAMSRSELDKLVLYCAGKPRIEADDVEAIVGDASEQTIDRILAATAAGDPALALDELDRAVAAGDSPQMVILWLLRHLQRLHRLRAQMDAGRSLDDAIRSLRPPLHFKQKAAVTQQLRMWNAPRLARALTLSQSAARAARLTGALEATLAERLVMEVAALAKA